MKVLVILALLFATEAHAQSTYTVSRITHFSSVAVDMATTERVLRQGGRELNPVLGQNPFRRNGLMIGGTIFADFLTNQIRKDGRPKLATALNFIISGLHFGAGIHNARQFR